MTAKPSNQAIEADINESIVTAANAESANNTSPEPEENWQRLSPYAILFFASRSLMSMIMNIMPLVIIGYFTQSSANMDWIISGTLIGASVAFVISLVNYWHFYYIRQDDRILVRQGVFSKQHVDLPFNKVQNIAIQQPFYYRPFGLATVKLDGAGSKKDEVHLAALTLEQASKLKQTIELRQNRNTANISTEQDNGDTDKSDNQEASFSASQDNSAPLIKRSLRDIIIYGLTHNRSWYMIALLLPAWNQLESVLFGLLDQAGIQYNLALMDQSLWVLGVIATLVLLAIVVLLSILSVLAAIFTLYDYTLSYSNGVYTRQSGLLNRYEVRLKQTRIQNIRYRQNLLERWLKRLTLSIDTFGTDNLSNREGMTRGVFVPSIRHDDFVSLSSHLFDGFTFPTLDAFKRIHPYQVVRYFYDLLLMSVLAAAIGYAVWGQVALVWVAGAFPVLMALLVLRWWRYGYWVSDDYTILRHGLVGITYTVLPNYKVQQATFSQSLFMQRRELADVKLVLASRSVTIPAIDAQVAKDLVNRTVYDIEFSGRRWM